MKRLLSFAAALLLPCASFSAHSADVTEERSYSVTVVHQPKECALKDYADMCTHLTRFWASRFGRNIIEQISRALEEEKSGEESGMLAPARQEITMSVAPLKELGFAIIGAQFKTVSAGESSQSYETFNLNLETRRPLGFDELFKDPEQAALICAEKYAEHYRHYHMPLFEVIYYALTTGPWNFMLRPDGIELVFAPGTAAPGREISSFTVKAADLRSAGIDERLFPDIDGKAGIPEMTVDDTVRARSEPPKGQKAPRK